MLRRFIAWVHDVTRDPLAVNEPLAAIGDLTQEVRRVGSLLNSIDARLRGRLAARGEFPFEGDGLAAALDGGLHALPPKERA